MFYRKLMIKSTLACGCYTNSNIKWKWGRDNDKNGDARDYLRP
jgi:hypothetical protein